MFSRWEKASVNAELYGQLADRGSVVSTVLSQRCTSMTDIQNLINLNSDCIVHPDVIPSMGRAAAMVLDVLKCKGNIVIATDYDCDGLTSSVVLLEGINHISPGARMHMVMGNRGQTRGLNNYLVQQILDLRADLVITADHGTNDHDALSILTSHGIRVVVTDHHTITGAIFAHPNFVLVNTHLATVNLPVAGCCVAWLLLVRIALLANTKDLQGIWQLIDYVAVASLADRVAMSFSFNRYIVQQGLIMMNAHKRICWATLAKRRYHTAFCSMTLPFQVLPLISAPGRFGDSTVAINFLREQSAEKSNELLQVLEDINQKRRDLQRTLYSKLKSKDTDSEYLVSYCKSYITGLAGPLASSLLHHDKKLVCILSPCGDHIVGSLRSSGLNIVTMLERLNKEHPQLMQGYGGHEEAGGLTILDKDLQRLTDLLPHMVSQCANKQDKIILYELEQNQVIYKNYCEQIKRLEPFGQDFSIPLIYGSFTIVDIYTATDTFVRCRLQEKSGRSIIGLFFNSAIKLRESLQIEGLYYIQKDIYNRYCAHMMHTRYLNHE